MIRRIGLVSLFCAAVASAAVSGSVVNGTSGQPQAAAEVTLYKFGQGGMEPVAHVKTDAQGNFSVDQDAGGQGPSIVRVERDGVTYNHLMPPGTPTTGFTVTVYDGSKQPGAAKVSKHMLLFQPGNGQMTVNETFIVENSGKTTWVNPAQGTIQFYLPKGANGNVDVKGTAPDGSGMSVPVPTDKTARPDIYAAKFEVKPGETRFDLSYTFPYTQGQPYAGKIPTKDDNTYLISPNGVTMTGDHLKDLGAEPRTQAHIFGLLADSYKVQFTGAEIAAPAPADSGSDQADNSGPGIEQIMPRIYGQAKLILALALGILALGFALLYRANPEGAVPKESNERGRN
jgi:hypothetical protein